MLVAQKILRTENKQGIRINRNEITHNLRVVMDTTNIIYKLTIGPIVHLNRLKLKDSYRITNKLSALSLYDS